jgi:LPS-assembly lipoprotein
MKNNIIAVSLVLLGGCGFTPLYGDGAKSAVSAALQSVDVAPIPDRIGQLVQDGLERQFNAGRNTQYQLVVTLEQNIEGFGIRQDESVTRERVSLVASYTLNDRVSGKPLFEGQARSDAGVDKVRSEYATIAAERAAAQRNAEQVVRQISVRLAQYFAQK